MCPVCGEPAIRRRRRVLLTCGKRECATELRARSVRGSSYSGGRPPRRPDASYNAVHYRARRALVGQPCALADESCAGRIEVALRADAPSALLARDPEGRTYYTGLDTEIAYRPLCRSHHAREGALRAAAARAPVIAAAVRATDLRLTHRPGHRQGCAVCATLDRMDLAAAALHRELDAPPPVGFDGRGCCRDGRCGMRAFCPAATA